MKALKLTIKKKATKPNSKRVRQPDQPPVLMPILQPVLKPKLNQENMPHANQPLQPRLKQGRPQSQQGRGPKLKAGNAQASGQPMKPKLKHGGKQRPQQGMKPMPKPVDLPMSRQTLQPVLKPVAKQVPEQILQPTLKKAATRQHEPDVAPIVDIAPTPVAAAPVVKQKKKPAKKSAKPILRPVLKPIEDILPEATTQPISRKPKMMHFGAVHSVVYFVKELAKAKQWYSKMFGILPYRDDKDFIGFEIGAMLLGLHRADKKTEPGTSQVAYWCVDDLNEATEYLLSEGAEIYRKTIKIAEGGKVCQLKDPFGNIIGLAERGAY